MYSHLACSCPNQANKPARRPLHHTCFVPPITLPLTLVQSMLASNSSSTRPHTTTLSPRIRYNPCSTSELVSGSSAGRITRSIVRLRTRLVSWSQDNSVPVSVRPSAVMTKTFSIGNEVRKAHRLGEIKLTIDVVVEGHY